MPEQKRVRRTPEQIAAAIDAQIEALEGAMQETEQKKAAAIAEFDHKAAVLRGRIAALQEKKRWPWGPNSAKSAKQRPKRSRSW